ncbi:hypothetical protein HDV00_011639, partial [Rhizophlyctis rosea]
DYNIEFPTRTPKTLAVYKYISDARTRGIPIHGVGFQAHFDTNWYPTETDFGNLIDMYNNIGVEVHITELDIKCVAPCDLDLQGRIARSLLNVCIQKSNCKAFLTWGISDAHSWVRMNPAGTQELYPLPYDEAWNPKPFYNQMLNVLQINNPDWVAWNASRPVTTTTTATTTTTTKAMAASPSPSQTVVGDQTGGGSGADRSKASLPILSAFIATTMILILELFR